MHVLAESEEPNELRLTSNSADVQGDAQTRRVRCCLSARCHVPAHLLLFLPVVHLSDIDHDGDLIRAAAQMIETVGAGSSCDLLVDEAVQLQRCPATACHVSPTKPIPHAWVVLLQVAHPVAK